MESEDEWGNRLPPNWGIKFRGSDSLRMKKTVGFQKLSSDLTFETWILLQSNQSFDLIKKIHEGFTITMNEKSLTINY